MRIFNSHRRFLVMMLVLLALVLCLVTYNYYSVKAATKVEAVDSLSGQRIGCCVAWEADYLLTPREDITLLRYDTNADCILALSFGQIDAMVLDEMSISNILGKTTGIEVIPEAITTVGNVLLCGNDVGDKLDRFNEFAASFVKSDAYEDLHARSVASNFVMAEIPELENGEKLVVGYIPDCYPEAYIDFTTGKPAGYGIEIVKRFAYECGYTVEWVECSETTAFIDLGMGNVDLGLCYYSDTYRDEIETTGYIHMTEPYLYSDIFLVKVKDGEKLQLSGEIDF